MVPMSCAVQSNLIIFQECSVGSFIEFLYLYFALIFDWKILPLLNEFYSSTVEFIGLHTLCVAGPDWEPEAVSDWTARVWCPDLLQEGHWHHLVFVLNRAVLKNSALSIYVDGQHVYTQKVSSQIRTFFKLLKGF